MGRGRRTDVTILGVPRIRHSAHFRDVDFPYGRFSKLGPPSGWLPRRSPINRNFSLVGSRGVNPTTIFKNLLPFFGFALVLGEPLPVVSQIRGFHVPQPTDPKRVLAKECPVPSEWPQSSWDGKKRRFLAVVLWAGTSFTWPVLSGGKSGGSCPVFCDRDVCLAFSFGVRSLCP